MRNQIGETLNRWRKLGLATAGIAALATPIMVGMLNASPIRPETSQTPAAPAAKPRLEFAAASVRVLPPRTRMPGMGLACRGRDGVQRVVLTAVPGLQDVVKAPLGRCVGSGVFLSTLIEMAYGVPPRHISGGPVWSRMTGGMTALSADGAAVVSAAFALTTTREEANAGPAYDQLESFQIEAVADNPSTVTLAELREMLQAMLADRFKLRFHFERKEVLGYALVVVERGHKMKEISGDYVESIVFYQGKSTMDTLAHSLSRFTGDTARIVNKTGLNGAYEYQFEPFPRPGPSIDGQRGGPGPALSLAEAAKNLSERLEEQIGLRLQAEQPVSIEALVIDSVERPSPN